MKTRKKGMLAILAAATVIIVAVVIALNVPAPGKNYEFLRVHIRADSNAAADQNVKYEVKDAVIRYLTPEIAECADMRSALSVVKRSLPGVEAAADAVLKKRGFRYTSKASLLEEDFPDRAYDGVVLPAGVYDALIINLGSGNGDNWWCVVYPPLCFQGASGTGSDGISYKSKIAELLERIFGK